MTPEIYLTIAVAILPFSWAVLARHWWKEFDKPRSPAFNGVVWACLAGTAFAVVWPVSLFVTVIWLTIRLIYRAYHR